MFITDERKAEFVIRSSKKDKTFYTNRGYKHEAPNGAYRVLLQTGDS
jgi:hypothetical protein